MAESFWGIAGGGALVVVVLTGWVTWFFGPYLKKKGENLATHEDIQRLVDQVRETERVKADITDRMWDRQSRWTAKKDHYVALVEQLTSVFQLMGDGSTLVDHHNELLNHLRDMTRRLSIARLFMPKDVLGVYLQTTEAINEYMNTFSAPSQDAAKIQIAAFKDSLLRFIMAARADLEL